MKGRTTVLVADDEPLAREALIELLERWPEVELVGVATSGPEVIELTTRMRPQLLFLDIEMPGASGLEALAALEAPPTAVLVTAHAEFAVDAFRAGSIDYVLKPYSEARLREAFERARKVLETSSKADHLDRIRLIVRSLLLDDSKSPRLGPLGEALVLLDSEAVAPELVFERRGSHLRIRVEDILWVEAADNYARVHTRDGSLHLVRATLRELEQRLTPSGFVRSHRSALVKLEAVEQLVPGDNGEAVLVLRRGDRVPVSRFRRKTLQARLGSGINRTNRDR